MDSNYELLSQKIANVQALLEARMNNYEDDSKVIKTKVDVLEKQNTKTDVQYNNIIETLKKLTTQVEELKDKPAKRYESIIGGILGAIFGAIGGAIAGFFIR